MKNKLSEQELLKRLALLPREIRPAQDPWPAISDSIDRDPGLPETSRSVHPWMWRAAVASAVLVLAAGLLLNSPWRSGSAPGRDEARATMTAQHGGSGGIPGLLAVSEIEYQAAFREFISVGDSRANLPVRTVEKIEKGWADLLSLETALAAALENNPADPFLNDRMLALRARQLGFLKQLVTLDRNNRRLTI